MDSKFSNGALIPLLLADYDQRSQRERTERRWQREFHAKTRSAVRPVWRSILARFGSWVFGRAETGVASDAATATPIPTWEALSRR